MAIMLIDGTKEIACRTAEANAIRGITGGSAQINYDFDNSKGFADAISGIMDSFPDAESEEFGGKAMPIKGQLITMNLDGTDRQYRVLKTDGTTVEVVAMFDAANIAFNANTVCCFVAGTQVLMANGTTKNIEDISIGDEVISYNQDVGENYTTIVDRIIIHENTTDLAIITLEGGKEITMNAYHPILTEQGWHSITNYNNFDTLTIGDNVKTLEGYSSIININRYNSAPITTYNIDVKDINEDPDIDINDNYYANGIVAHNAPC